MASVRQKKRKLQERRKQFVNQLHLSIEMQLVCIHGVCTMAFGMLIFLTLGFMIYHSELKATSLELRLVSPTATRAPSLVLAEGRRGGKPGLTILPPLVLQDEDGADSPEIRRIYHMEKEQ